MIGSSICVTGLRGIPDVMGGPETHCEELLPRIALLAPELSFEVLGRRHFVPANSIFRGVKVRGLPAPQRVNTEAIVSTFLGVIYAARHARLIHIHAIGPALMTPLARLLGLRVVVTHHGADYDRAKWGRFAKFMLRLGERLGIAFADQVIVVAPTLTRQLQRRFPRHAGSIHYIPNGAPQLPDEETSANVLERFGLRPRGYVLAVGRLVPEKGFDYLVRAFERSGSGLQLIVVGADIHDSDYAKSLVRRASDRVHFLGSQPRSVLRRLYENADFFVMPSFHEGLPISALEAASCGTPMLLSDIPANVDIGLASANYFPTGDEDALAERLGRDGSAYTYDVRGVMQSFDWDRVAEQTLTIYRRASR
jgi:glycosyltransferase involved in cell wall biosynthesis